MTKTTPKKNKQEYQVCVWLSEELYEDLNKYCERYYLNRSNIVRSAIRKFIGSDKY